ncbi:hypothetical protein [Desulfosarcina ovata]|nr:hypothetical protein [Desulfosarcina ovata]
MTIIGDSLYTMLSQKLRGFEECDAPRQLCSRPRCGQAKKAKRLLALSEAGAQPDFKVVTMTPAAVKLIMAGWNQAQSFFQITI